jgi:hypothetical protein
MFNASRPLTSTRIWIARGIAVAADVVQIGFSPVMAEGFMSPFSDALDAVVAVVLTLLVGWHIAFVPSFLIKMLPVADLAPTWTIAILLATRGRSQPAAPPALPPSA